MLHTDYGYETKLRDRLLVITLYGEIDHHSAVGLREDLDALILRERPLRLVLDLSRIEFMDSAGLGLLMGRYRLMRELGGEMAVDRPNERILKILRLSGMERFFEIEDVPKGEKI
jgi:stage II sporulation protein AA (anti-sigma F factor antagonist)